MKDLAKKTALAISASWIMYFSSSGITESVFENNESKGIELAAFKIRPRTLYIDTFRPLYIQRRLPSSQIFYDLNARFTGKNTESIFCEINLCVHPEAWIFTTRGKDETTFSQLKKLFAKIYYEDDKSFIATTPVLQCPQQKTDCGQLRMYR